MFEIPQSNVFNIQAYCNQYDPPLKYELRVLLWNDINKLRSTWGFDKDGNYQATLRKLAIGKWDDLFKSGTDAPANIHRWVEMEDLIANQEGINIYKVKKSADDNISDLDEAQLESTTQDEKERKADPEFISFMNNGGFKLA
jgi:hypothetical protein